MAVIASVRRIRRYPSRTDGTAHPSCIVEPTVENSGTLGTVVVDVFVGPATLAPTGAAAATLSTDLPGPAGGPFTGAPGEWSPSFYLSLHRQLYQHARIDVYSHPPGVWEAYDPNNPGWKSSTVYVVE
jgi:hypothetical protein